MATKINTTNVGLSELETAPGGGATPVGFATSGRRPWNEGNQGSQTVGFYTWGYGFGSGGGYLDPIYGLNPPTTGTNPPLSLGDWKDLQYWFDGTTFDIKVKWQNLLAPNPPGDEVDIQVVITDSTGNYSIFRQSPNSPPNYEFSVNMPGGASQALIQIPGFQADSYVLAKNLYWYIEVAAGPNFGGGTLTMDINGTGVLSTALAPGPFTGDLYDWNSAGGAGETNSAGCEIEFTVS
jgi:hypothetical protein